MAAPSDVEDGGGLSERGAGRQCVLQEQPSAGLGMAGSRDRGTAACRSEGLRLRSGRGLPS